MPKAFGSQTLSGDYRTYKSHKDAFDRFSDAVERAVGRYEQEYITDIAKLDPGGRGEGEGEGGDDEPGDHEQVRRR